jgi:hypothetical protein
MLRRSFWLTVGLVLAAVLLPLGASQASAQTFDPLVVVSPNPIVETDWGGISFALEGMGFPALMRVELSSPGLNRACRHGQSLHDPLADFNGNFNQPEHGRWCAPGTYAVIVSEKTSPYQSFETDLTILPPGSLPLLPPPGI